MKQFKPVLYALAAISIFSLSAITYYAFYPEKARAKVVVRTLQSTPSLTQNLTQEDLRLALGKQRLSSNHMALDYYPVDIQGKNYHVQFTLNKELQERIERVYERYAPAYAAFVALDPETGKILAMVDYSTESHKENLNLSASYPAASIFKMVTGAAALAEGKIRPKNYFPVNGSYGTLYKRNLSDAVNRWTRYISIEEAFAKSVNSVFAKIAMQKVGPQNLQKYADGFTFNQAIPFDMNLETGHALIPTDDSFGLAESGSGYTRRQTMSPIQGALIAAAMINGGRIPKPYVVKKVETPNGISVYEAEQEILSRPLDVETARSMSRIMEHTVTQGTARREYRDYNHHPLLAKLFIGGKTGSLSGDAPAGKYDWFVGFAQSSTNPKKKIAYASMIVNRKYWRVKSAHVAREAILEYFSENDRNKDL